MDLETILGAIIAGCIGILTARYSISHKEKITKKNTAKALSFEIKANQERLKHLTNLGRDLKEGNTKDRNQILREIRFERTVYSALSDRIGLLNLDDVVKYYTEIKLIEEQCIMLLRDFFKYPISKLINQRIRDRHIHEGNDTIGWDEIEEYFAAVEKTYSTGDALTRNLKSIFNNASKTPLSRLARKYK
jgi:hypothetical protein